MNMALSEILPINNQGTFLRVKRKRTEDSFNTLRK